MKKTPITLEMLSKRKAKKPKKPPVVKKPEFKTINNSQIVFIEGYYLPSRANIREHWTITAKKTKEQRSFIKTILNSSKFEKELPSIVTLCRIAPRRLDGGDNIGMAFKAIRDGITDWFGLKNDDDSRLFWMYAQESIAPKYYALRITLTSRP